MGRKTDRVIEVDGVSLRVGPQPWPYAMENRSSIEDLWTRRASANPHFFNGVVHVVRRASVVGRRFVAELARTDFASYLHWRESGYAGASDRGIVGVAALVSSDGQLILASQAPGRLNSGRLTFIGGIVDQRDCAADGRIDIDAQIRRELAEETALGAGDFRREPGYVIVNAGPIIVVAVRLRASLSAAALAARIRRGLASETDGELADVVVLDDRAAVAAAGDRLVPYARLLAHHLLA